MRRKVCNIALWTGLLVLSCSSAALALSLEVVPASPAVTVGTPVAVDLVIAGLGDMVPPSLSTFDLDVLFNPAVFALDTSDTNGDGVIDSVVLDPTGQLDVLGLGGNIVGVGLVGPGTLNLMDLSLDLAADLNLLQAGSFPLATITFQAIAVGTSTLNLIINALGDADGNVLTADVSGGAITVRAPTSVPEPGTWLLLATGVVGLLGYGWRRRLHTA